MLAATVFIAYQNLLADWVSVAVTVALTVIGLPYYYLYLRRRRGDLWTLPDPVDDAESA